MFAGGKTGQLGYEPVSTELLRPRSSFSLPDRPWEIAVPPLGLPEDELTTKDQFRTIMRHLTDTYPLLVVEDRNTKRLQLQTPNNIPYDRWIMNWLLETNLAMPCFDLAVTHLLHRMATVEPRVQEQEHLPSLCIALLLKREILPLEQGRVDLDFTRLMYLKFRMEYDAWLEGAVLDKAQFEECRALQGEIDANLGFYDQLTKELDPGHSLVKYVDYLYDIQDELKQDEEEILVGSQPQ